MTLRSFKNPHTAERYAERRNSSLIAVRPASGRNQRRGCRSLGMAVTAICLLAGMLSLIPSFARAQDDGNIFSAILGSANQLGQEMNTLFQEEAKMQANLQQVVAPATQLLQIGMKLQNMYQTYWGLMNSLRSVAIQSASIPQTVTLENSMYGRLPMIPYLPSLSSPPSTALSPSAILPNYLTVYGSRLAVNTVPPAVARQVDMEDASANEALVLASKSDQYEATVVNVAGQLQKSAAGAAPGTADFIQAESAVVQLHSQAVQHRLLASMLRQRATQLAAQISQVKQSAAGHGNSIQNFQQLLNGVHQ